jgi:hypothetical protein
MKVENGRMDIQRADGGVQTIPESPNGLARSNGSDGRASLPRLMRVSEIDKNYDTTSPLGSVVGWIRYFLARPHPQLGRPGLVCPFVPTALKLDTIWLAEMDQVTPSFERLCAIMTGYRQVFLKMEPTTGPDAMNKVFLMAFPSFGADGTAIIEKVQSTLKRYFVEIGLLVGEFHAANEGPGLHNSNFRPLRSPVPMLAIRHLVESDLAFLNRDFYPPEERSSYLRSYLFRLGGSLSQVKFNEAVNGLIAAEMAMALHAA